MTLTYQDFFPAGDVATYRRVKRGTMKLAEIAREEAARLVGGEIGDGKRSSKEFVRTRVGLFRMAFGSNSDNTTERAAHRRMGAVLVVMGDRGQMEDFFERHGLKGPAAYAHWFHAVLLRVTGL